MYISELKIRNFRSLIGVDSSSCFRDDSAAGS